jgi:MarR family transcriptional regulator, lower aerobic nicotinate degradation pathway regulator
MTRHPAHLIRRCYQIFLSMFGEMGNDMDLTPARWIAVATIHAFPGLSMTELSQLAGIDKVSCGRTVKYLESKGYVEIRGNEDDYREKRLYPLPETAKLVKAFFPRAETLQDNLLMVFDPCEAQQFTALLQKFLQGNSSRSRVVTLSDQGIYPAKLRKNRGASTQNASGSRKRS